MKDLPVEKWKEEIYNQYGEPTEDKPLEEMIDTSNIHRWLQNRIEIAKKRHAAWITFILNENKEFECDLINLFKVEGEKIGSKYREETSPRTPDEIYSAINDFILEGMPCDRVTEFINKDENELSWNTTRCLHKEHWENVNGDVTNFYNLRDAWIKGFVEKINSEFYFQRLEDETQKIIRK